nr:hypothetical protein [Cypionkella psychrotolerans]
MKSFSVKPPSSWLVKAAPPETHIQVMPHLLAQPSREIGHLHRFGKTLESKTAQKAAAVQLPVGM